MSVEETIRNEEICYYVHAQSHGELDNVPMGTSVTGIQFTEFVIVVITRILSYKHYIQKKSSEVFCNKRVYKNFTKFT